MTKAGGYLLTRLIDPRVNGSGVARDSEKKGGQQMRFRKVDEASDSKVEASISQSSRLCSPFETLIDDLRAVTRVSRERRGQLEFERSCFVLVWIQRALVLILLQRKFSLAGMLQ